MNETDLRDLLPAERRLSPARRRDMEERLMEQITKDVKGGRRRYRLVVGAVAATLLLVAGVLAISLGDDEPDSTGTAAEGQQEPQRPGIRWAPVPEEADAALARYAEYGSGEVPYLSGSDVGCVVPLEATPLFVEGDGAPEMTSLGGQPIREPLDRALTAEDYVDACRMRAVDIAAMAMPETCVTRDFARGWIEDLIAEEELGLEVTVPTDEELVQGASDLFGVVDVDLASLCFYGMIYWGSDPPTAAVNALPPG